MDGRSPARQFPEMVAIYWDAARMDSVRQFGQRLIQSDEELESLIKESHDDLLRLQRPGVPLTIDADSRVPWDDVVEVINIGKRQAVDGIEFATGPRSREIRIDETAMKNP